MSLRLLLVRHAIAEKRKLFSKSQQPDELRPLTPRGRKKMRRNAVALSQFASGVNLIATSPLTRAVQTSEILKKSFPGRKIVQWDALRPGKQPKDLLALIQKEKKRGFIALVGHEPHLSSTAAYFLTGKTHPIFLFEKGSACIIDFYGKIDKGRGELVCLIQPSQLELIGKRGKAKKAGK